MSNATLPCPMCRASAPHHFNYDDVFGQPVPLHKCLDCGHGFHGREYSAQQFTAMYEAQYAQDYQRQDSEDFRLRQVQYGQDVALLLALDSLPADTRVFDYGCSSGLYLQEMPTTWKKSGYEVNPSHVAHVRREHPHIAIHSDLAQVGGQFDLITLRGVIEHIPEHSGLLSFLREHLAPGGRVFITATPDFSSVCAGLYKASWNQLMCPEHIHQFTPASLSLLLAGAGLALRALHHPYLDTPYARWEEDSRRFLAAAADPQTLVTREQARHAFCGNMLSALFQRPPAAV